MVVYVGSDSSRNDPMVNRLKFLNSFRLLALLSTIIFTCFLGAFAPLMAQLYESNVKLAAINSPIIEIRAHLNSSLVDGQVGDYVLSHAQDMKVFYRERDNRFYWNENKYGLNRPEVFLSLLEKSWTHGLNPENYSVSKIRGLISCSDFLKRIELELLLTEAFIDYVRDISGMRVDATGLRTEEKSWRQKMPVSDVLSLLDRQESVEYLVAGILPQGKTYKALQKELVRLSFLSEEKNYASVLPIKLNGFLRPAERHERISDIRMRLGVEPQYRDLFLYDDRLVAAVMKFQRENGLTPDGIIGSNTLYLMNRTNEDKMHQIIVNMERLRWVDGQRPDKFIIVNIPSATLWAIDNGKVDFEMDVIVGSAFRPTESFVASVDGVRFNPDWTIPTTVKLYDMVPKLKADPAYFVNKGIEVFDGYGNNAQTIDPLFVDWDNITRAELSHIRMVQIPGDHNALGRIRVLMQNKFNIYLHDTNHKELFEETHSRYLSSGCVRLKEPRKVAEFIMRDNESWSEDSMDNILETLEKTDVPLDDSIPVYVLYYTVWIDDSGKVIYGFDVYRQDKKLIDKLANIDGFHIPGHNERVVVKSDQFMYTSVQ